MDYRMIVVGGPNGSGKSTIVEIIKEAFARRQQNIVYLNADEVTKKLRQKFPNTSLNELNLRAAQMVDDDVYEYARRTGDNRQNFLIETVLSSPKYIKAFQMAKVNGYITNLTYMSLCHPDINVERVRARVLAGGHDVPEDKIRSRYYKSHDLAVEFFRMASEVNAYDNSEEYVKGRKPFLKVGRKRVGGSGTLYHFTEGVNLYLDNALRESGAVRRNFDDAGPSEILRNPGLDES